MSRSFSVTSEYVRRCLHTLRRLQVHRTFSGFLAIKRTAAIQKQETDLEVDFKAFFEDYLRAPGGPQPYLVPFVEIEASPANEWLNQNVAGSYAPSSLREASPLLKVVSIQGEKRHARYTLLPNHDALALTYLANGSQIPVLPLSIVLYRDYALEGTTTDPTGWIEVFKREFGYLNSFGETKTTFHRLFIEDWEEISEDWIVEVPSRDSRRE